MAKEYRKRLKELYGHPGVLGQDVISVSVGGVSGVAATTALTAGTAGCNRFVVPRAGYLDYILANVSPAISAGSLNVAVYKNGVVVHSGSLTSSNADRVEKFYSVEEGSQQTVASGDLIQAFYSITSALSVGAQAYGLNARVGLTYREPN